MYLLRDISAYFLDTFTSLVLYNYSNNIQNHMVSTVKRNCNLSLNSGVKMLLFFFYIKAGLSTGHSGQLYQVSRPP